MEKHQVVCDACKCKADLRWNGQHWLPPVGWVALYDMNLARILGQHLCPKCAPKRKP